MRSLAVCVVAAVGIQTAAAGWSATNHGSFVTAAANGLPPITAYDSLLVARTDPRSLLLGTQNGLFRSTDGGRTWTAAGLKGEAVTSLVQAGQTILAGGRDLLAASRDGGATWRHLHPRGLPNDHIAALGSFSSTVYAVVAGAGLYRSTDGGRSFSPISLTVGPAIRALALTPKHIIAGDVASGVYLSADGRDWWHAARGMVMSLAVDPDRGHVLAASWGIARSTDGGRRWRTALRSRIMFGAVAWAPGDPSLAYAVGENGTFWRSRDGGLSWAKVRERTSR